MTPLNFSPLAKALASLQRGLLRWQTDPAN